TFTSELVFHHFFIFISRAECQTKHYHHYDDNNGVTNTIHYRSRPTVLLFPCRKHNILYSYFPHNGNSLQFQFHSDPLLSPSFSHVQMDSQPLHGCVQLKEIRACLVQAFEGKTTTTTTLNGKQAYVRRER